MRIFFTGAGLGVWTLLIYGIYWLSDGIIGLGASSTGSLVETGRQIAGDKAGRYLDTLNVENAAQKGLTLLQDILGPLLAILWLLGAGIIFAIPWLAACLVRYFRAHTSK